MKKTIITGILFLAIVSISAQEKGTKNTKPIKYTKGTNSSVIVEKEVKTEKTTPISIRPTSSNSTNRAAQTTIQTNRPEKVNTNRAAQTTVQTNRPEKVNVNERTSNREEKPLNKEFSKLSAEYCRGWKEGYMKAWLKAHKGEKLEFIPNCKTVGSCEGYKCGFKAGMKQVELNIR